MYDIAQLDLPPLRRVAGTVRLPGSKSISNRVLLLAGLSEGRTEIHALLDSDDTRVMLGALARLGCRIETAAGVTTVHGIGGSLRHLRSALSLSLGNAGTAMRPLTAALALMVTRDGGDIELSGVARMHERPIGDLVDALRQLGAEIDCLRHDGFPPLRLRGIAGGTLRLNQPIRVRGDVSSQFLTALLLALPLASASQPIVVDRAPPRVIVEKRPKAPDRDCLWTASQPVILRLRRRESMSPKRFELFDAEILERNSQPANAL